MNSSLAKLDDGFDENPTVMFGEKQKTRQLGKNRGILKPSWAFVETNKQPHNLSKITQLYGGETITIHNHFQ